MKEPELPKDEELDLIENDLDTSVQLNEKSDFKNIGEELFTDRNINLRTELNAQQIRSATRLRFLEKKYGLKHVDVVLSNFLTFQVSKDRKGRSEFVEVAGGEKSAKRESIGEKIKRMVGGEPRDD